MKISEGLEKCSRFYKTLKEGKSEAFVLLKKVVLFTNKLYFILEVRILFYI